jgi:chemotaxis protein CheD
VTHLKAKSSNSGASPELPTQSVNVGIGAYHAGSLPMTAVGLGSCIALVLHDPKRSIGACAHIMLPESCGKSDRPGKYADTAIPLLIEELIALGGVKRSFVAKIVGGASMFSNFQGKLNIGERNIEAVRAHLGMHGIPIKAEDLGGKVGRTLKYNPLNGGNISVKRADGSCSEL